MRLLPIKRTDFHNKVIWAVFDFFGQGLSKKEIPKARDIAIYLMGRKKGITLDDKQKDDLWHIKENLKDPIYVKNLLASPPKTP